MRGLSDNTRSTYLHCVVMFVRHFKRSPSELGAEQIRAFHLHLREMKRAPSTIVVYVCALRFLYWVTLRRRDLGFDDLPRPKIPKKQPPVLAVSEVESIFAQITSLKHRAILFAAYGAGLRVSEACGLRVDQIDSARMVLNLDKTKRNIGRTTLLSPRLLEALRAYWSKARPKGPYLFPGRKGSAAPTIGRAAVSIALKKAVKASGVTKRVTPHTFRHSFATHLSEGGLDIRGLQILLGHASIRSTTRYVQMTEARIKQIVSPLEKLTLGPKPTITAAVTTTD